YMIQKVKRYLKFNARYNSIRKSKHDPTHQARSHETDVYSAQSHKVPVSSEECGVVVTMEPYSNEEYADMHFMYGFSKEFDIHCKGEHSNASRCKEDTWNTSFNSQRRLMNSVEVMNTRLGNIERGQPLHGSTASERYRNEKAMRLTISTRCHFLHNTYTHKINFRMAIEYSFFYFPFYLCNDGDVGWLNLGHHHQQVMQSC
ncbi:hypothetical protein L9F63_018950, partial [Diploptera punctata]